MTVDKQWMRDRIAAAIADRISKPVPASMEQVREVVHKVVEELLADVPPLVKLEPVASGPDEFKYSITGPRDLLEELGFDVPPPPPIHITLHFDIAGGEE